MMRGKVGVLDLSLVSVLLGGMEMGILMICSWLS